MELNDLILLAAAPIYARNVAHMSTSEARTRAIKEAKRLWEEALKQDKEEEL
jgi:hypothetical protein